MPFHSEQKSQFIAQSAIKKEKNDMKRIIAFAYGIVCYAVFLAALLYTIGFLGNSPCRNRLTRALRVRRLSPWRSMAGYWLCSLCNTA